MLELASLANLAHHWCCACKKLRGNSSKQKPKKQQPTTACRSTINICFPTLTISTFQPKHLHTLFLGSLQLRPSKGLEPWIAQPNTHTQRPCSKPAIPAATDVTRMMHIISVWRTPKIFTSHCHSLQREIIIYRGFSATKIP